VFDADAFDADAFDADAFDADAFDADAFDADAFGPEAPTLDASDPGLSELVAFGTVPSCDELEQAARTKTAPARWVLCDIMFSPRRPRAFGCLTSQCFQRFVSGDHQLRY
jgi:hypothetical protein